MQAVLRSLRRFRRNRKGNIAVIFALASLPVVSMIGCAVDYSRATQLRSKLMAAADAASVGSVARTSPAFIAAGTMNTDGVIASGATDATNIFNGNMAGTTGYTLNSLTPAVTKTGSVLTSVVSFDASIPTNFLGMLGRSSVQVTGSSTSTTTMPRYIDFYLLLDNSPSMGVAATTADVTKMVNNTSDKCAFACHDYNDSNNYYNLAKTLGVTTRIDVLRQATQNLMDTATATRTYSNQFRMAIYDFGASSKTIGLRALYSLSSNLSNAKTAASNIDLMGVYGNNDSYTADKDSQFSTLFPAMNNLISTPGNGNSGSPLKYLFFVSDGLADEYNTSCKKPLAGGGRCQSPIDPAICTPLKNRGIKIAVLYTTYLQLPTNSWYMSWIDPFNKGPFSPSPNSEIAQNMESCASPGFYFEVGPNQGISEAMTALFQKAVADARISN